MKVTIFVVLEKIFSIICESKGGEKVISLGRLALIAVLVEFFVLWHTCTTVIPAGLLEVFYVLSGYVLGGKALKTIKALRSSSSVVNDRVSAEISDLPKESIIFEDMDLRDLRDK